MPERNHERVGHPPVTNPDGPVYINLNGIFVTAEDGHVTIARKRCNLGNPSNVRGFILLHELGHQLGIFGKDAGPDLQDQNAAHSMDIINHCFAGACLLE